MVSREESVRGQCRVVGESGGVEGDEVCVGSLVKEGSVAGGIEGGEAGGVFGEFVRPEVPVGC